MSYANNPPLSERAHGKWHGILSAVGMDKSFLTKKNGPCPFCGGRDRWRWTDHNSNGNWVCNKCGTGDGIELVKAFLRTDFKGAAERIESVIGTVEPTKERQRGEEELRAAMRKVWAQSRPITPDCPAGLYLSRRGVVLTHTPRAVRWVPSLWHAQGDFPAMVAQVVSPDGKAVNIHRTWLTPDGQKAPVEPCRKIMAGSIPKGSAIRLFNHKETLGIAEGIETAYHASNRFNVPVWSLIAEGNLQGFRPPEGVTDMWVFGDADKNYVGQAAAYIVARDVLRQCEREKREIRVRVAVPDALGTDWADVTDEALLNGRAA